MKSQYRRRRIGYAFQAMLGIVILLVERVVGLPVLYLGLVIQASAVTEGLSRRMLLLVSGLILGFVYGLPLVVSCGLVLGGWMIWLGSVRMSSSKTFRLLLSLVVMTIGVIWANGSALSFRTIIYSGISFGVIIALAKFRFSR